MEKLEQLVKALGIDPALVTEDADIKAIAKDFLEKKAAELVDNDAIDSLKTELQAEKEAAIVKEKKMKRALNSKFQLGLTNTTIDTTDFEKLVEQSAEKIKATSSEDTEKLKQQIFDLTNENNKLSEEKENALKENDQKWQGIITKEKVTQEWMKLASKGEYIVPSDELIELAAFKAQKEGYDFQIDEKGIVPIKNGVKADKPDNTGKETFESFTLRSWEPYVKKSNGTGTQTGFVTDPIKENTLSPEVQERINQMKAKMGQSVAA